MEDGADQPHSLQERWVKKIGTFRRKTERFRKRWRRFKSTQSCYIISQRRKRPELINRWQRPAGWNAGKTKAKQDPNNNSQSQLGVRSGMRLRFLPFRDEGKRRAEFRLWKRATCDWPRWTSGGGTRSARFSGRQKSKGKQVKLEEKEEEEEAEKVCHPKGGG